ncbi:hypothetical protein [Phormidium nigroviride]
MSSLEQTLEEEAKRKIKENEERKKENEDKIKVYNEAIKNINNCLEAMQLYRKNLPLIKENEFSLEVVQLKSQDIS